MGPDQDPRDAKRVTGGLKSTFRLSGHVLSISIEYRCNRRPPPFVMRRAQHPNTQKLRGKPPAARPSGCRAILRSGYTELHPYGTGPTISTRVD
eukprot:6543272-Prymnesium_polylepis.1